jgi:hypothetical protein
MAVRRAQASPPKGRPRPMCSFIAGDKINVTRTFSSDLAANVGAPYRLPDPLSRPTRNSPEGNAFSLRDQAFKSRILVEMVGLKSRTVQFGNQLTVVRKGRRFQTIQFRRSV